MPTNPKPPGHRVRRNVSQPQWQQLPASDAPPEGAPSRPRGLKSRGIRYWTIAARSPMAHVWVESDWLALERAARIFDIAVNKNPLLGQLLAIEDRLGLSPASRRRLMWEIERAGADPGADDGTRPSDVASLDDARRKRLAG